MVPRPSPILLGFTGIQLILAIIEIILASLIAHSWGIVFSVINIIIAITLIISFFYGDREIKMNSCAKRSAIFINLLLQIIIIIFISIQAVPAGSYWNTGVFPTSCGSPLHCTRITSNGNVRATNISTPLLVTLRQSVIDTSVKWINNQHSFIVLQHQTPDGGYYIHSKFISSFFAFPDDFGLYFFCNNATQTEVWIESESRIGSSDLGVNDDRSINFVHYLSSISFVPGPCS